MTVVADDKQTPAGIMVGLIDDAERGEHVQTGDCQIQPIIESLRTAKEDATKLNLRFETYLIEMALISMQDLLEENKQ